MTVAAVQFVAVVGDVADNIARSERIARKAIARGAHLIVFPELSLTGYHLDLADGEWFVPGDDRLHGLRRAAADADALVVVGAPVIDCGARCLASLVVGGASDLVAAKTHLHGGEVDVFVPAEDVVVAPLRGRKLGFAVCLDTAFGSHADAVRVAGADAYIASVLYAQGEEEKHDTRMSRRARDTGMAVVSANLGGFPNGVRSAGCSGVWASTGLPVASALGRDDEVVLTALP
ncbi:carbon-nitrogen hydrolase family protein [Tsukamurella sputi]|uniref:carbon-nitrogen hydrolase family protein n=1 Tax=Tsukamurella sputi TaxID=2591848 RepID=UPI0013159536|nr:carbon-nitrogen hydrolase family protein [Tsukamurella sputi]